MKELNKLLNTLCIIGFILLIVLMVYVVKNAEAFKENPCKVCEEKHPGKMVCTQTDPRYIQKTIDYGIPYEE